MDGISSPAASAIDGEGASGTAVSSIGSDAQPSGTRSAAMAIGTQKRTALRAARRGPRAGPRNRSPRLLGWPASPRPAHGEEEDRAEGDDGDLEEEGIPRSGGEGGLAHRVAGRCRGG